MVGSASSFDITTSMTIFPSNQCNVIQIHAPAGHVKSCDLCLVTFCAAIESVPTKNVAMVKCSSQMACPSGITGTQEAPCESPCKCLCKRKETGRHQTPEPTRDIGLQHVCLFALHIEYQGKNKGHPWHSHTQTHTSLHVN